MIVITVSTAEAEWLDLGRETFKMELNGGSGAYAPHCLGRRTMVVDRYSAVAFSSFGS